jgi:hypothetical protein
MMIDFPNAPTDGQTFLAPTGVLYRWVAASSLWIAASGTTPGGDFCATFQSGGGIPTSDTTLVLPTVATGNSGGWYSNSTGRFTPPAGRFFLFAEYMATQTAGSHCSVSIRKNGAAIQYNRGSVSANGYYANPSVLIEADANGTDWFDMQISANAGATGSWFVFGAFPISGVQGVQGPPGPGNAWRILSRQVVSAAQPFVELASISSDINELDVHFDLVPVTNDQNLMCQFYGATGVLDVTTAHYSFAAWGAPHSLAMNSAPGSSTSIGAGFSTGILFAYAAANAQVSNSAGSGIKGSFKIPNIKAATRKALMGQCYYLDGSGSNVRNMTYAGDRSIVEAITGLRLSFVGAGNVLTNIASGSFEVWGSP